jgi:hypothetical protein
VDVLGIISLISSHNPVFSLPYKQPIGLLFEVFVIANLITKRRSSRDRCPQRSKNAKCSPSASTPENPQPNLPHHLVWPITFSEAESAAKVGDEKWFLLDGCEKSLVDGLLVCCAAAGWLLLLLLVRLLLLHTPLLSELPYLWLLSLLEECLLSLLLLGLVCGEVSLS